MIWDHRMLICLSRVELSNILRAYGVTENTPPSESLNLAYEVSIT